MADPANPPDPSDPTASGTQLACLSNAQNEANASFSNAPVTSPVAACDVHWVSMRLIRQPDVQLRPDWWPPLDQAPYKTEQYKAQITNGPTAGNLDDDGFVKFSGIPAGSCQFVFANFYKEIEDYFSKQLS